MIDIVNGTLRISVRNLVEFICRKGDIDNRFSGVTDKTAMDAGSRAHRKIQKSMGGDYNAEVSLSYTYDNDIYDITVEGRADGIFNKDGYTYVDEIKGIYKDVKYLSAQDYAYYRTKTEPPWLGSAWCLLRPAQTELPNIQTREYCLKCKEQAISKTP